MFLQKQEEEISALTDRIYELVAPWGEFKRATKQGIKEIVTKVAKLGLEMAQLPFSIQPMIREVYPGVAFDQGFMEDVEGIEDLVLTTATIILSYPWIKVTFDDNGNQVPHLVKPLSKARISCLA